MRGVLQDIVVQNFACYARHHRLSVRERKAARSIRTCRTAAQGVHVRICPQGDYVAHFYNSCKHRSCPRCGGWETERWVQQQEARLLPCAYYHIVFTLPQELNVLWRYNRGAFENQLFQAAWATLRDFFRDEKWVGGLPGALMVFQSWGETLNIHPHLHVLITAGGLSKEGRWMSAGHSYLLPTEALTIKFKGKFLEALGQALFQQQTMIRPHGQSSQHWSRLMHRLAATPWHAHIQPPYSHPMGVIRYLAFYIRGGPIAEDRIQYEDADHVRISYKRPEEHRSHFMTLTAPEFLSRFLVHVPAKGVRMVRAYGLFHHRVRERLELARHQLAGQSADAESGARPDAQSAPIGMAAARAPGLYCPNCGCRLRVRRLAYGARAPPEERAA
jgi:hypothetical protein